MKFLQMGKRVLLFALVNFLVITTITIVISVTGLERKLGANRYHTLLAFCFIWGMGGAFVSLALSRVMAKWFQGVKVIDPGTQDAQGRALVSTVHGLAGKAGLDVMPEVGIYESDEVNAFATGPTRNRSLVAVSTGLLRAMERREVEGVLAHEVAHIANGDMVTMTLVQGVINAFVMFLARVLAFVVAQALQKRDDDRGGGFIQFILVFVFQMILSVLGTMVVCWFSRWREFRADAGGAELAGKSSMIAALSALGQLHTRPAEAGEGSAAFQSLKISNPQGGFMRLFMTHPPLEERIARLNDVHA